MLRHGFPKHGLLLCSLVMLLGVSACGSDQSSQSTTQQSSAQQSTPSQPASSQQSDAPDSQGDNEVPATAAEPAMDTSNVQSEHTTAPAAQSAMNTTEKPSSNTTAPVSDANKAGLDLAQKSGCLACHAVDRKVVGPAWQDVAKRYAGDAQAKGKLIEKISKGGRGNWTDVVGNMAMPPYSPRVSAENIEKLVTFILSL